MLPGLLGMNQARQLLLHPAIMVRRLLTPIAYVDRTSGPTQNVWRKRGRFELHPILQGPSVFKTVPVRPPGSLFRNHTHLGDLRRNQTRISRLRRAALYSVELGDRYFFLPPGNNFDIVTLCIRLSSINIPGGLSVFPSIAW